jgi:hypothetical protein
LERKRGGFLLPDDACRRDVGIQVILGVVMGGHLVPLVAFLVQAEPCPAGERMARSSGIGRISGAGFVETAGQEAATGGREHGEEGVTDDEERIGCTHKYA